jgi:hypothetical protein
MSDQMIVALVFLLTYGTIIGYAWYLHLRRRRARS